VHALGDEAGAVAGRELGRALAHVVAEGDAQGAGRPAPELREGAGEGAPDDLGHIAVDLGAVAAADVVGLEDVGIDVHAPRDRTRAGARRIWSMSGHSKWAGIKHKKAIVDARRGAQFTKL